MNRRRLLGVAGALGTSVIAGCVGGGGKEEFALKIADQDFGPDEDGYLVYNVTLSNPSNDEQSGTVYLNAEVNDEDLVRVREVTLSAHETREVTIRFDVKYENITSFSGSPSVEPLE